MTMNRVANEYRTAPLIEPTHGVAHAFQNRTPVTPSVPTADHRSPPKDRAPPSIPAPTRASPPLSTQAPPLD